MTLPFIRPDLPGAYPFRVTQQPCRAKLDQNEVAIDLPDELKRDIADEIAARPWNRYVQPAEYADAKRALGAAIGADPDTIAITVGGDQAIEAAFLVAGGPRRTARWFEPTYPYVAHAAARTFTREQPVPLGLGVDELTVEVVVADPSPDLIVFVAPNNPTGGMVAGDVVDAALSADTRLVFIDEAYHDFSRQTFADRLDRAPNLLIGRSMSKSSLAAGHVGFVLGHPEMIAHIERLFTAPYHVNVMQIALARRYGDIADHVRSSADSVIAERARVIEALRAIPGITPRDSHANFVLFSVEGPAERASAVHAGLADSGVRVRNLGAVVGLAGTLRVTIGTAAETDLFLAAREGALGALI